MWDKILYPFAYAIAWLWVRIHDLLVLLGFGSGAGLAWVISIILLTILVRALIIPLYLKQIKSSRGMYAIQPEMKKIQAKYKGKTDMASRQRQQEEISALQKKHGFSPFASCLPALAQMPVFFGMYRAIYAVSSIADSTYNVGGQHVDSLGSIDQAIATEIHTSTVFGVPLSHTIYSGDGTLAVAVFIFFIIVMVATQFFTIRMSFGQNMPKNQDPNNPMVRSQKSMMYMMPALFIFSGLFFQMGIVIYTTTTSIWAYLQTLWLLRNLPSPGSPAYEKLLMQRQNAYQEWARPFFADYDRERGLALDDESLAELNERTLVAVQQRAKKQKIASDFPEAMTAGEKVTIYRNLSAQEWTTLPDEMWMKGIHHATERSVEKREQQAKREETRKRARDQRSADTAQDPQAYAQAAAEAEELERRRQERRKARRQQAKKKR